jgi:hypothetical protein
LEPLRQREEEMYVDLKPTRKDVEVEEAAVPLQEQLLIDVVVGSFLEST